MHVWAKMQIDSHTRVMSLLAKLNVFVATVTRWPPMGADMVPAIVSMVEFDEEEEDDSIMQEALGIGPAPDIHTGVKTLAEKYKKTKVTKPIN